MTKPTKPKIIKRYLASAKGVEPTVLASGMGQSAILVASVRETH
jgi:hypothetical protein